ncbi:MAG: PHP domain-containing protein [Candidatus Limnocylindrales bacterium]
MNGESGEPVAVGERPSDGERASIRELVFADLHCHSAASFDSLSKPADLVRVAFERGLTHLAITDHERIEGAQAARDLAPHALTVIVGEEIRSIDGDVVGLYLERAVPPGLSALETIAAIHAQGGLAGIPHPFDRFRASGLASLPEDQLAEVAAAIDYVETWNARVPSAATNERARDFAVAHGLPGVASSDAHSLLEVGVASTRMVGPISGPADLQAALATATLTTGRASYLVRGLTPVNKVVNRLRGNVRVRPSSTAAR